ncbi:hypothetical protein [Aurantibacillus circumpalustris]|uniref:hypothetical protein n=1 Tax=Aurantibacillus circumpalustris TaxID=3036359 RepID=UPI00295BB24E|nr:hypothetical protein [Aurantibacillus circumpalustris]
MSFEKLAAQTSESVIFKEFVLKDSSSIYKSAVILVYNDGTFLNYGIVDNKQEQDVYVWYKSGSWKSTDNGIIFSRSTSSKKAEELKQVVKREYRSHPDRVLIQGYYEFVHEKYEEGSLLIRDSEIVDQSKKIDYVEIKI